MRISEIATPDRDQIISSVKVALEKYSSDGVAGIFKGSDSGEYSGNTMFFRDPMSFQQDRQACNTSDDVNTFVSNHPSWKGYPPRNRSLICSGISAVASTYGKVAVVVPLVDTTIGICSSTDWWFSFDASGVYNIRRFNYFIRSAVSRMNDTQQPSTSGGGAGIVNKKYPPITYQELVDNLEKLTKLGPDAVDELLEGLSTPEHITNVFKEMGWLNGMAELLNPAKNGITKQSWGEYNRQTENEVWLSAPCVMIPFELFYNLRMNNANLEQEVSKL